MIYALFYCRTESHPEPFTALLEVDAVRYVAMMENWMAHKGMCDEIKQIFPDFKDFTFQGFLTRDNLLTSSQIKAAMEVN